MKDSAFPMMIVYLDMDQVEIVKTSDEIEPGRSFIILETQCPMIQWAWFSAGAITAIIALGAYYFFIWG